MNNRGRQPPPKNRHFPRCRAFYGRRDRHPDIPLLRLDGVEGRTTYVEQSQGTGFVERMHRRPPNAHIRVIGGEKLYETVDEMQADLSAGLVRYDAERPHQGCNNTGRTSAKVFRGGLPKPEPTKEDKMKKAA